MRKSAASRPGSFWLKNFSTVMPSATST